MSLENFNLEDGSTIIYLIRHGTTDYNKKAIFQGSMDIPLDELGLAQAEYLAKRLEVVPLDGIYSSPLKRAFQTAQTISRYHGDMSIAIEEELREMNGGLLEGNTSKSNSASYPEAINNMRSCPSKFQAPGGESMRNVYSRSIKAFHRIVAANPGKRLAVVSHGFVIQAYMCYSMGMPFEDMCKDVVSNASLTCLKYKDSESLPEIVFFNDDDHIPEDAKFVVSKDFFFKA